MERHLSQPRPGKSIRLPVVDAARCTGCGWCVSTCGPRLLSLQAVRWKKTAVLQGIDRCTGCRRCALKCPFDAITMQAPGRQVAPQA